MDSKENINLNFEKISQLLTEVKQLNHKGYNNIKFLTLVKGDCLQNALKVSSHIDSLIVEGILETHHKNGDIQCVGHVWNKINDEHIDYTFPIKFEDSIIDCKYYSIREYLPKEKNLELREIA